MALPYGLEQRAAYSNLIHFKSYGEEQTERIEINNLKEYMFVCSYKTDM